MFNDLPYSEILGDIFTPNQGGNAGSGSGSNGDDYDVISTTTTGARTTSSSELQARIAAAGGALITDGNSSDFIVAKNNPLRFTVTRQADGRYKLTGNYNLYLLGGGAVLLVVVMAMASK